MIISSREGINYCVICKYGCYASNWNSSFPKVVDEGVLCYHNKSTQCRIEKSRYYKEFRHWEPRIEFIKQKEMAI